MRINKDKIKKFFIGLVWLLAGVCFVALLVSGVRDKDARLCKGVQIEISGVSNNFFIDKNDVYAIIKNFGGDSTGRRSLASINLLRIEKELEKDLWVKDAELFFDNNDILKVSVQEREPVARVFTLGGNTFYIDSSCMRLPLSDKFSARLPLFTGFTSDAVILSSGDSSLLSDIENISLKIRADSFLMAMIDQVDIMPNRSFEMTPTIGKQKIIFGDASNTDEKFSKLKLFYKNVIPLAGWSRYKTINLQYKNQVVGVIRGLDDVAADSVKTLQMIKSIADDAAKRASDSIQNFIPDTDKAGDSSMVQQSIQRDDEGIASADNMKVPKEDKAPLPGAGSGKAPPVAVQGPKPPVAVPKQKPTKPPIKKTAAKSKQGNDY